MIAASTLSEAMGESSSCSTLLPTFYVFSLFNFSHPVGGKWYFTVVFELHFPDDCDVEHIFLT